jgi:predicted AAA+ superfamily ATPase
MIPRLLFDEINRRLFSGKSILLIGPRQVGKTTLIRKIADKYSGNTIWLNADNPDDRELLNNINGSRAVQLFQPQSIVVVDEAQRLENSGLTLKIIHDHCSDIQLIATGSRSFELSDKIRESMTGRKWTYKLYPISLEELISHFNPVEVNRMLENRLIFGSYPDVINHAGSEKEILLELTSDYLYRDLFRLKEIRKPELLEKLVKALAFQAGNEVSNRELGNMLQADKETVERYLYLLEEAYIIFRLPSFSKNLRNELKNSKKIYFYDNGIRNAVINQFNGIALRNDIGQLWENLMISERIKHQEYHRSFPNRYFWRTSAQQEIDYLEESEGRLRAFEFKWSITGSWKPPATFIQAYPDVTVETISRTDYLSFVRGID